MDAGTVVVLLKNETDLPLNVSSWQCEYFGEWVTSPPNIIDPHSTGQWATKPANMFSLESGGTYCYTIGDRDETDDCVLIHWDYDTSTGAGQSCQVNGPDVYECTPPDPSSYAGANPTMVFTLSKK